MIENETDWELHFNFSRKVSCDPNTKPDHDNIHFELIHETNQVFIKGLTIELKHTMEDTKEIGTRMAKNFANYLSLSSGIHVDVVLDGIRVKNERGGYTVSKSIIVSYLIENISNLLISDSQLLDLMNGRSLEFTQQLAYLANAMESLEIGSPQTCIRDLVLVCNQNPSGNLAKFRSLRNALSHKPVYAKDIQNIKIDFGVDYFDFTSEGNFDYTSTKNKEHLIKQARYFLSEVRHDLLEKFNSKNSI